MTNYDSGIVKHPAGGCEESALGRMKKLKLKAPGTSSVSSVSQHSQSPLIETNALMHFNLRRTLISDTNSLTYYININNEKLPAANLNYF